MYALGALKAQNKIRWVLLRKEKTLSIEKMGESDEIPLDILTIKNLTIVTGLSGASVLRRDLKLPLTSKKDILKALSFQLEPLLPFPLDQSVVYTQLHPAQKETLVVAWASTTTSIQKHLEEWKSLDSDIVSSESLALARYAQYKFPESSQLVFIHDRIGIAIDKGVVVCAMESSDPARLKLFLEQKYPLFEWIEKELEFAIPFGLALEAYQSNPCQFLAEENHSQRKRLREKSQIKQLFAYGLGLICSFVLLSETFLRIQESKINNQISAHYSMDYDTLKERVEAFRFHMIKEAKGSPPSDILPPVKDLLAWISSFKAPVEIQHLDYDATDGKGIVTIEFESRESSDADLFVQELKSYPTFIESNQEIKWTVTSQGYKLSFQLRKMI